MSSVDETLHELADLFCELYDAIDIAAFGDHIEEWLADTQLWSVTAAVAGDVEHGRRGAEAIRMRINSTDDPERQRFACLRGIDRAFASVNPAMRGAEPVPSGLTRLALHVAAYQRLDSGANGGALLPRLVNPAARAVLPNHPRELFASVVRVPEASLQACSHVVLGEAAAFHRHEILAGVRVGCVPFIADPDELDFETETRAAGRFYRIAPRGLDATRERIARVIANLDGSGVMIGMVPELTLTSELLSIWKRVLAERELGASKLHWLLVGSGDLTGEQPPKNTAVLLNGRTGEVIAEQDKLYPFALSPADIELWNLQEILGTEQIEEDLKRGERLFILEANGMRVAIMVCEDLARVVDLAGFVRDFGVSHVLVPVFARPNQDRRWERAAADVHAASTGSTIAVANSLVMASILGEKASGEGTCLVVWPGVSGALVLKADAPDVPMCFQLHPDGMASSD